MELLSPDTVRFLGKPDVVRSAVHVVSGFMRWSKRTRGGGGVMRNNNCKLVVRKSLLSSQLYTLNSPSGMTQVFTRAHFTPRFTQSAARSQVVNSN